MNKHWHRDREVRSSIPAGSGTITHRWRVLTKPDTVGRKRTRIHLKISLSLLSAFVIQPLCYILSILH